MTHKIVKQIRLHSNLTQSDLSRATDYKISPSAISKYERDVKIGMAAFLRLCEAAKVKPSEIFKQLGL